MNAPDPHLLGPGLLPTPFTADEIRRATGNGKTIRLRIDLPDGSSIERINRFRETDAEGATLDQCTVLAPEQVSSKRVTWSELQAHAAFPAETTTVSIETIDLPMGALRCLRYDTEDGIFWFSVEHPGMPVRYQAMADGGVMRTTVLGFDYD